MGLANVRITMSRKGTYKIVSDVACIFDLDVFLCFLVQSTELCVDKGFRVLHKKGGTKGGFTDCILLQSSMLW